jgi:hypothetical protein
MKQKNVRIIRVAVTSFLKKWVNLASVNPDSWLRHTGVLFPKQYGERFRCVVHITLMSWIQIFTIKRQTLHQHNSFIKRSEIKGSLEIIEGCH